MKKPHQKEIEEMVKSKPFQWYVERLAFHLNEIDTVRNVKDGNELVARKLAIEIIENALADVYEAGNLAQLQKKLAEEENSVIKSLKQLKSEY